MNPNDQKRLKEGRTPLPTMWIGGAIIVLALAGVVAYFNMRDTNTANLPGANSSSAIGGAPKITTPSNTSNNPPPATTGGR